MFLLKLSSTDLLNQTPKGGNVQLLPMLALVQYLYLYLRRIYELVGTYLYVRKQMQYTATADARTSTYVRACARRCNQCMVYAITNNHIIV